MGVITISIKRKYCDEEERYRGFDVDTILNHTRLTNLVPAEEVRKKFEVVNTIFRFGERVHKYIEDCLTYLCAIGLFPLLLSLKTENPQNFYFKLIRDWAFASFGIVCFFSLCFAFYRRRVIKRFINESFEDWRRKYQIQTKYKNGCCCFTPPMLCLKHTSRRDLNPSWTLESRTHSRTDADIEEENIEDSEEKEEEEKDSEIEGFEEENIEDSEEKEEEEKDSEEIEDFEEEDSEDFLFEDGHGHWFIIDLHDPSEGKITTTRTPSP